MAEDLINTDNAEQENASFGMKHLISSLIHDVMTADMQAADDFVEIVENKAVDKYTDANGEERYRLKTVDYELVNEEGKVQVVTIPYISLLALPSLRISEATFELEAQMEVLKEVKKEENTNISARTTKSIEMATQDMDTFFRKTGRRTPRTTGTSPAFRFTTVTNENSTETDKQFANVKISIKLTPTVLPNGVRGLLQYAGANISETITEEN